MSGMLATREKSPTRRSAPHESSVQVTSTALNVGQGIPSSAKYCASSPRCFGSFSQPDTRNSQPSTTRQTSRGTKADFRDHWDKWSRSVCIRIRMTTTGATLVPRSLLGHPPRHAPGAATWRGARAGPPRSLGRARRTAAIVLATRRSVADAAVGPRDAHEDLVEALAGLVVHGVSVAIGVQLERALAEGRLDLGLLRRRRHAQQ